MQRAAHGEAYFEEHVTRRVLELMRLQCSARRSAYQAIHKHGLEDNDVKVYVKKNYMEKLNQRYVSDAVSQAKQVNAESAIFGGKKLWQKLVSGTTSKDEWQQKRNNQLYSRGDKAKNGNANIRVVGDKILINDPSSRGLWLKGKLFLPDKWNPNLTNYQVQIIYTQNKFKVTILWEEEAPAKIDTDCGAIGVDTNPDGCALSEVNSEGNLVAQKYILKQRIQFASESKRDYDVAILAKEVVDEAVRVKKPIVIEKLSFNSKKKREGSRKFKRMKHNFLHKKILDAIISRAVRCGVPVLKVNPAFTSDLGMLKYQTMYSLSQHNAAALVIARRGLGIKERQTFTVMHDPLKKTMWNLEGRGKVIALKGKAYSWLLETDIFLKSKSATLTASSLAAGLRPATGLSAGEIPASESCATTGRARLNTKPEPAGAGQLSSCYAGR
jgi:IS605 OrfB family transposase